MILQYICIGLVFLQSIGIAIKKNIAIYCDRNRFGDKPVRKAWVLCQVLNVSRSERGEDLAW